MNNFKFFDNLLTPILILDKDDKICYKNTIFDKTFSDFTSIKKFSRKFNFDLCTIDESSIEFFSPIYQAIISKENFSARISYQNAEEMQLYFDFYCQIDDNYKILTFNDITAKIKIENLEQEKSTLNEKYQKLKEENESFIRHKQKAQIQAIKMVLINKITNIIRKSIDIDLIINSTLQELLRISGCFKAYFASIIDKSFLIEYMQGDFDKSEIKTLIRFDDDTFNSIVNKKITHNLCLKEHSGSKIKFKKPTLRVIIPIYNFNKLIGIVVLFNQNRKEIHDETDILESMSVQLGNAITQASLFQQINQQKNELQNTLKELKDTQIQLINSEKMASLGQLIAGVAHEINTPIASIMSNNAIFKKVIDNMHDKEKREMLQELNTIDKEAILRISNIVKSLKRFVRLDEAELQEADVNKEIDLTLDLIRHETKNKVEIVKKYANLPKIKCYPNMLNQVFMNLLVNACQSIEKQGIITITTKITNKKLIIIFEDTGCGIPKKNLENIFNAGFTTKKIGVGTGLGLVISKRIIDKHKGSITVKSKENKGSEFIITIPR